MELNGNEEISDIFKRFKQYIFKFHFYYNIFILDAPELFMTLIIMSRGFLFESIALNLKIQKL